MACRPGSGSPALSRTTPVQLTRRRGMLAIRQSLLFPIRFDFLFRIPPSATPLRPADWSARVVQGRHLLRIGKISCRTRLRAAWRPQELAALRARRGVPRGVRCRTPLGRGSGVKLPTWFVRRPLFIFLGDLHRKRLLLGSRIRNDSESLAVLRSNALARAQPPRRREYSICQVSCSARTGFRRRWCRTAERPRRA